LKILFVNYMDNRKHMEDIAELFSMHFIGPLHETDLAEYEILWIGPWCNRDEEPLDWLVFERCVSYQPDVVFVYGWWTEPMRQYKSGHITLFTLYLIRKLLGIKVTALMHDQRGADFRVSDQLTRFCDLVFTHEHEEEYNKYTMFPHKHFTIASCYSPSLFHRNPSSERDIDVTFIGSDTGYANIRQQGISQLREAGIRVHTPGGRSKGQRKLTNKEYAEIVTRSKIIINWSRHISGKWFQAKGRIFEATLGGSMLLCEECDPVSRWFRKDVDYVPFTTNEELVEKAKHYLESAGDRLRIANSGHEYAIRNYSAEVVWGEMVGLIQRTSHYDEGEALEGIRENASEHDLYVARFMSHKLKESKFDKMVVDGALEIIEQSHSSILRTVRRRTNYLSWKYKRTAVRFLYGIRQVLYFITPASLRRVIKDLVIR
jgi:hypothetical protein